MDTMTEAEIRNSTEFAEWITRYNKLNHADLTTKTAPYYLFVDYLSTLISSDESETINELTAENAKLREQLAEAESALEAIADMTMSMVVNVQHMNDERGRIARAYLSKHNTTT